MEVLQGRPINDSQVTTRRGSISDHVPSIVSRALRGEANDGIVRRVSAGEIEAAVLTPLPALLRQPEVVVGTWVAAKAEDPDLTESDVREALARLEPLWDELSPAEQQRIVRTLVERVTVGLDGAEIRLRVEGLASLVRDLGLIVGERGA